MVGRYAYIESDVVHTGIFDTVDRREIAESDLAAVIAAFGKEFIVKSLAKSDPVSTLVETQKRHDNEVNILRRDPFIMLGFMNIPGVLDKHCFRIESQILNLPRGEVYTWNEGLYSRMFLPEAGEDQIRLYFVEFIDREKTVENLDLREINIPKEAFRDLDTFGIPLPLRKRSLPCQISSAKLGFSHHH